MMGGVALLPSDVRSSLAMHAATAWVAKAILDHLERAARRALRQRWIVA